MHTYLDIILSTHSLLRYLVLGLTLIVAIQSLMGMMGKKKFQKANKMGALFMMIFCDVQLLAGLALYFMKGYPQQFSGGEAMKNPSVRFFALEHPLCMVIGIVLVHIGYSITKKNIDDDRKFKRLFWCSLLALVFFLARTPWPGGKEVSRPLLPAITLPY